MVASSILLDTMGLDTGSIESNTEQQGVIFIDNQLLVQLCVSPLNAVSKKMPSRLGKQE